MNPIDRKLREKLKLFEDIDRQLQSGYPKNKPVQNSKPNHNKQIPTPDFDQIYSNFLMSNVPSRNIPNTSPKNTHSTERITNTKTHSKESTSSTNCGERLYNYGFYIKNKLEKKRQDAQQKIQRDMTPRILARSKSIDRDSNKFEYRLYYQSHCSPSANNDSNDTSSSIYKKKSISKEKMNPFNYKPELDKNSLLIAKKLEPSSSRLMKKKKKIQTEENPKNNSFYTLSPSYQTIKPKDNNNIKKLNELYQKGMENIHKREKMHKEKIVKEQEEYKQYTFQPKTNKNSSLYETNVVRAPTNTTSAKGEGMNSPMKGEMYKKQFEWKKRLDNENRKKREKKQTELNKECTFKPEIAHLNIQNDEKFIMKNIKQMNDYVNRRRDALQKQKDYEEYKKKKFGENVQLNIKPTIVREFKLSSDNRSKSRSKSNSRSRGNNTNSNNIRDINPRREELKTFDFFNNNLPIQVNSNNKNKSRANQDQEDFIRAVNAINYQISNLNI